MNFLGIDYGEKRIGLAVGDSELRIASPIKAAIQSSLDARLAYIQQIIQERRIHEIVIGYPYNMDGSIGFKAKEVDVFVEKLIKLTDLPIHRVDERLSSRVVKQDLQSIGFFKKKRSPKAQQQYRKSGDLDSRAASLILQDFLEVLKWAFDYFSFQKTNNLALLPRNNMKYVVAALYKFVKLADYQAIQAPLLEYCKGQGIKGTLLLAEEGINGTVAGTREGIDNLLAYLKNDARLQDLEHKESFASEMPFLRMKVKLKKEIVTLGVPGVDPTSVVGTYLNPEEWNALIQDPEVILIDTRNDYEIGVGTFKNAIDPKTKTFREFPDYVKDHLDPKKHKKVAMYCTGGIRCEKSTSYLKQLGFDNVYHLKGGILKYLEEVPQEKSLWEGECFVFDDRVAVGHGLVEGHYDQCHGCRRPITEEDKRSEYYVRGVSCPHCINETTLEKKQRAAMRQKQIDLAKSRGKTHLGSEAQVH